jgi:hypothetical protein
MDLKLIVTRKTIVDHLKLILKVLILAQKDQKILIQKEG